MSSQLADGSEDAFAKDTFLRPSQRFNTLRRLLVEIGAGRDHAPTPFVLTIWRSLRESLDRMYAAGFRFRVRGGDACINQHPMLVTEVSGRR